MPNTKTCLSFILFIILSVSSAHAGEIRRYSFGEWCKEIGYSQAVAVDHTLYLSGIIGNGETMEESLTVAMEHIDLMLKRFNLDQSHILKEKVYTNDIESLRKATHIRKEYYKPYFPAAVWIGVTEDKMPGKWVEIELIVHIPDGHLLPEAG